MIVKFLLPPPPKKKPSLNVMLAEVKNEKTKPLMHGTAQLV